eukprot:c6221_g1_i1.p1 GENE.c6221_g1_i1~~c6221_g1_i1.p1  ORF type:complete len:393 (-),score=86.46 c6221_g1_i1:270-1448(-)
MTAPVWLLALLVPALGGIVQRDNPIETEIPKVVYGQDNRREVCEVLNDPVVPRLVPAIAAFINSASLVRNFNGRYNYFLTTGATLATQENLCPGQRFAQQFTKASCSATLIAPDRVITAGHCMDERKCRDRRVVFDFYLGGPNCVMPDITDEDVYRCKRFKLIHTSTIDYAVVFLDRPVVGRTPVPVQSSRAPVHRGQQLILIGFPNGIPAKVDQGGVVLDPRQFQLDFFYATTDTFTGNSGSGVFDTAGTMVGLLVRGARDYDRRGNCNVVHVIGCNGTDKNCNNLETGEAITYAFNAIAGGSVDCHSDRDCTGDERCDRSCSDHSCTGWCYDHSPSAVPETNNTGEQAQSLTLRNVAYLLVMFCLGVLLGVIVVRCFDRSQPQPQPVPAK